MLYLRYNIHELYKFVMFWNKKEPHYVWMVVDLCSAYNQPGRVTE